MNKRELVEAVAEKAGITKKTAGEHVEAFLGVIQDTVAKGERVGITGFGSFERADYPAREARNPATGGTIQVAARSAPKFKAGADFRGVVATGGARLRAAQATK